MYKRFLAVAALTMAMVNMASAGISVSAPGNGATVANPMRIVASATPGATAPITAMGVYVDGVRVHTSYTSSIDTAVTVATGTRTVTVQSWDSTGAVQKSSFSVNVTTAPVSGVTVSMPANGATVSSPTRLVASAKPATSAPITAMGVYADGVRVLTVNGASIDTNLTLATGTRNLSIQAWDSTGAVYKAPLSVNVTSTTTSTAPVTGTVGKTIDDIEQMPGWESCDKCAGIGGDGPSTPYSMTQGRTSPSQDGNSTEFWLGGTTPYAQALWWKQLGGNSSARHFTYELNFYMTNPGASQALEFDVNQSVDGRKYIFGTECNLKETKTWRVWDPQAVKWINTGVHCAVPRAYAWNNLVWEFERTTDNKVKYISVTYNGVKQYINWTFNPLVVNAYELNVAFQMDGDYKQTNHSTWLDNVRLTYW